MKKNPLYSGEPHEWNGLPLHTKIEWIRLHLCTGPCGQSQQVMTQRERINRVLLAAMAAIPVVDGSCEHGTADGEFCEPCNREIKLARDYEENR